jgi:hypothetical protein
VLESIDPIKNFENDEHSLTYYIEEIQWLNNYKVPRQQQQQSDRDRMKAATRMKAAHLMKALWISAQ